MKYGCIGEHLTHSFSREIHNRLDSKPYELCELKPSEVLPFLEKGDFQGINVTIPYKKDVIPALSFISEEARAIGAVNTIRNEGGSLSGFNTDAQGMTALIERIGADLKGKKVLILGTGGTSRTASFVAKSLGAKEAIRVSRSAKDGAVSYDDAVKMHRDAKVLINTTPCGMFPKAGVSPIDLSHFPRLCAVIDAIYNPLRSKLILDAKRRGIPAEGGLFMLVMQGVRASEIFLKKSYPREITNRIFDEIYSAKENIVLIGMPASGKSTIGKAVAQKLGRDFFDSDSEIEKKTGKTISQIFAEEGEAAFRDLEAEIISELGAKSGIVLATGGGAVLREENRFSLTSNGRIYLLDRPLEQLIPTSDRPLGSTKEAIEKRYNERKEIYHATADCIVPVSGIVEEAVQFIEKDFLTR